MEELNIAATAPMRLVDLVDLLNEPIERKNLSRKRLLRPFFPRLKLKNSGCGISELSHLQKQGDLWRADKGHIPVRTREEKGQ